MAAPECPECGSEMVLKTARRGRNAGGQFWGCTDYPDCDGLLNLDAVEQGVVSTATGSTAQPKLSVARPQHPDVPAPKCPECGNPMSLRTARRGRNAGGEFWGCTQYPACKGLLNVDEVEPAAATEGPVPTPNALTRRSTRRVEWRDGTLQRNGWTARYTLGGAALRSVDVPPALLQRFATCWIAREESDAYQSADPATRRVIALLRKILQRGSAPPLHPYAERALLGGFGFGSQIQPSLLPGDLAPRLDPPPQVPKGLERVSLGGPVDVTQSDLPYDSDAEQKFHQEWVPGALGPGWAQWFIPQASLDLMLIAANQQAGGDRRVDFLISSPWCEPFVVEIDGDHVSQATVDEARDVSLRDAGYSVVRVPVAELDSEGPGLAEVRRRCETLPSPVHSPVVDMLHAASQAHRLVLALLEALASGFLAGDRWVIDVRDPTEQAVGLAKHYLDLFAAAASLWGDPDVAPASIEFCGGIDVRFRLDDGRYVEDTHGTPTPSDVIIHLDGGSTAVADLPVRDGTVPRIVVRSAYLPVDVRDVPAEGAERVVVNPDREATSRALEVVLTTVFAKDGFREGQVEAILEVLAGRDCVVLLPTGAGKSLIYQLAGLCMPGRTLVIDPLVALIEDQVLGLQRNGIDRVSWITSDLLQQHGADALLDAVESADALFMLVSPERLQTERFRQSLSMLAIQTPINLAVVDEAHCVSEWGHQFRTSYLNLGATIGKTCSGQTGARPPVLALTGTASRAVLRDVLFELQVEERSPNTLIRPVSFDRPELHYRVVITDPSQASAILQAAVRSLPAQFNQPGSTFFSSRGHQTASGIVFTQVVNGKRGVIEVATTLGSAIGGAPVVYSGSAPKGISRQDWSARKAESTARFKGNEAPVLVSTNAFGMGIDKPNIRWVAHYGLPGSIESFYQEVGRAGRDGRDAQCVLVYSEFDEERDRALLSEDLKLEAARARCDDIKSWAERDDVTSALFFHFNSFRGIDAEVKELEEAAALLEPSDVARAREIPFGNDDDARERALHRLVLLGVVRDYLVDWGSRKFTVTVNPVEPSSIERALVSFVERSQPGRVDAIRADLAAVELRKVEQAVSVCGQMLISFVYDTIERSRRRSLREMWAAVKEARTDADLRRRVLDYLSEGDVAPLLETLAEAQHFDLAEWRDAYSRIVAIDDAREWRGACARLLASFPDQPGLLVGRAIVELVDPDGDLADFHANLDSAFAAAPRYGIESEVLGDLQEWLLSFAARCSGRAFAAALAHFDRGVGQDRVIDRVLAGPGAQHSKLPGVAVVILGRSLRREVVKADELIGLVRGRYQ